MSVRAVLLDETLEEIKIKLPCINLRKGLWTFEITSCCFKVIEEVSDILYIRCNLNTSPQYYKIKNRVEGLTVRETPLTTVLLKERGIYKKDLARKYEVNSPSDELIFTFWKRNNILGDVQEEDQVKTNKIRMTAIITFYQHGES